ncbi:hypothetical protein K7X08_024504 [Anisodus acutangulus]|uniref:Uncharacterized protein n=1 Tax=Anisodus acutangulus TaxID=402998 RepID=A0A9Q1MB89_9SOLA|nr:hypothetical protein K7X08_024504 [Anisodus acutangulus]
MFLAFTCPLFAHNICIQGLAPNFDDITLVKDDIFVGGGEMCFLYFQAIILNQQFLRARKRNLFPDVKLNGWCFGYRLWIITRLMAFPIIAVQLY